MTKQESEKTDQALPRPVAVQRTLDIFSDPWSFAVLQELFFGVRRFDDFQRNLGISRSVLTRRLRHLEEQEIIKRQLYCTRPDRYEYRLTARGRDMYPIFAAIRQWGEHWLEDAKTPQLQLIHNSCGHKLKIKLLCAECHQEVQANDMHYEAAKA